VNVNPAYRSHDLGFVLKKSHARPLSLESDARADYGAILEEARGGQDMALQHTIQLGSRSWTRMLENGRESPNHPPLPSDPVNIQYTSGTTGTPNQAPYLEAV
jgi:fatty-acyl-CoA synthase